MRIFTAFLFLLSAAAHAQEPPVDYLNLGATLLQDGYVQRSHTVLEKVDVKRPDFDFARYYTLRGIVYHRLGYPVLSNIFLEEAISRGQENPSLYIYIARNHWQKRNYSALITALDKAGDKALENQQMFVIKAEAHKQLGDMRAAWAVLDDGIERFPEFPRLYSQKFYYLVELGFFQQAQQYAEQYLARSEYTAKDYLAIGYTLRQNKQYDRAAVLLEQAVLRHPGDEKLLELLGQVYIDQQAFVQAALVFDWASIRFPRFAEKAAALYLKAGDPVRSLQLNRRIIDQKEKFRQRLSIDIELGDYESLVAKTEALKRYGLLEDDRIVYALGYAHFRNREYDLAMQYLKTVEDQALFAKASQLFQQIETCRNDSLECR
jgi:tetratricopeptide (TPR) repeat protein